MQTFLLAFVIFGNLVAGAVNLVEIHRRRRAVQTLRTHLDKSTGAVAFTTLVARDDSPVADSLRALARRAYPDWRTFDVVAPLPDLRDGGRARETVH